MRVGLALRMGSAWRVTRGLEGEGLEGARGFEGGRGLGGRDLEGGRGLEGGGVLRVGMALSVCVCVWRLEG